MTQQKSHADVEDYVQRITERYGWKLTDDQEMLENLVVGLQTNFNRLGYYNCPCRDTHSDAKADRDIICPCVYAREADVEEYGYCYCALFFRKDFDTAKATSQIPERRPPELSGETR